MHGYTVSNICIRITLHRRSLLWSFALVEDTSNCLLTTDVARSCCCASFQLIICSTYLQHTDMPVLCIGPVCIPLNLLLPFLLGIAHRYGLLRWVKREWVTWTYWKQRFTRTPDRSTAAPSSHPHSTGNTQSSNSAADGGSGGGSMQFVCEGDVCRLVSLAEESSKQQQQAGPTVQDSDTASEAAGKAVQMTAVHSRKGARQPAVQASQ